MAAYLPRFVANGIIALGDVSVELKDIKVHNSGDLLDPTTAFNNGDLTIEGTIIITASNNKQHKINISYVENFLYVSYNDSMNIKLSRESLDEIVALVKKEFNNVLDRLNYSELIPVDTFDKLTTFEFNLGIIPRVLKEISCSNGVLELGLDTSIIDFDKIIKLFANVSDEDILSLTISVDEYEGTINLDNTEFEDIVAPIGNYLDFSGITKLLEGAVNAILKESGEYYLQGKITLNLDSALLNKIGNNVEIDVTAVIRLVDDIIDNEVVGKKVEAYIVVNTSDKGLIMSTVSSLGFINAGTGIMVIKDGKCYIERYNKKYISNILVWKSLLV